MAHQGPVVAARLPAPQGKGPGVAARRTGGSPWQGAALSWEFKRENSRPPSGGGVLGRYGVRILATAFLSVLWIPIAAILEEIQTHIPKFALTFTHCMHTLLTPPGARIRAQGQARMQTHIVTLLGIGEGTTQWGRLGGHYIQTLCTLLVHGMLAQ